MKHPIKKKAFKKLDIYALMENLGLVATKSNMVVSSADKPKHEKQSLSFPAVRHLFWKKE